MLCCIGRQKTFVGEFKKKVVERALMTELKSRGLAVEAQRRLPIFYRGENVDAYASDFGINDRIIVELKAKPFITREDEQQFWCCLRGSQRRLGFLANCGREKRGLKRRVHDKARGGSSIASSVDRCFNQCQSASAGFTLVEALVVTGVVMLLSTVLIVYNNRSRQQISLFVEQVKISQLISRAKSLAIATYGQAGEIPCGYGFYVDYNNEKYGIFKYDSGKDSTGAPLPCGNIGPPTGTDPSPLGSGTSKGVHVGEEFKLNPNLEFVSAPSTPQLTYVFFVPPVPRTILSTGRDKESIYLTTRDRTQQGWVTVNSVGQIDFGR